jgi:quercetin dioxygenase-like cupin family protein
MRIRRLTILAIAFAFVAAVVAGQGTDATIVQNSTPDKFQTIPNVPKCLTAAVQQGDPAKGPPVLLIKGTAGCKAPWHWHTPNEQVMMVSGRGQVEMKGQQPVVLRAGGFAAAPSKHPHEFTCVGGGCQFFLHSDGPFDIHYIDQNGKEISPEQALGLHKK